MPTDTLSEDLYTFDSPAGTLFIFSCRKFLRRISFSPPGGQKKDNPGKRPPPPPVKALYRYLHLYFTAPSRPVPCELHLYRENRLAKKIIHGHLPSSPVLPLDFTGISQKQEEIYLALLEVPPGWTVSYGDLALRAGISGGARFAGTAMRCNPFSLVIPCHRVIKSDGTTGGFTPDPEIKLLLLRSEGSLKK